MLELANFYYENGFRDDAVALYREILAMEDDGIGSPMMSQVVSNLAVIYREDGNKRKALEFFRKSLLFDPDNWTANKNLELET